MRKMIIECDKCHEEISDNPIAFRPKRADRETGDFIVDDSVDDRTFELCDDCMDKLIDWMTGREQATAPEPKEYSCGMATDDADMQQYKKPKTTIVFATAEPDRGIEATDVEVAEDPKEVKKPKKRDMQIDHGKIRALYNAGWKPKDIAGDMSLEVKQVYNSIHKHK